MPWVNIDYDPVDNVAADQALGGFNPAFPHSPLWSGGPSPIGTASFQGDGTSWDYLTSLPISAQDGLAVPQHATINAIRVTASILTNRGSFAVNQHIQVSGINDPNTDVIIDDEIEFDPNNGERDIFFAVKGYPQAIATLGFGVVNGGAGAFAASAACSLLTVAVLYESIASLSPNFGPTGQPVTISGHGFLNDINQSAEPIVVTGVTFGGIAATSVVVVNDTTITCVAPAGAGTVDIKVLLDIGSGAPGWVTFLAGFLYSGGGGNLAGGTTVHITGAGPFTDGMVIYVGDVLATGTFIDATHYDVVTPPHTAGMVDIVIGPFRFSNAFTYVGYTPSLLDTSKIRHDNPTALTIHDALNSTPNSCTLAIELGIGVVPSIGQKMQIDIGDGFGVLFLGNVQSYDQEFDQDVQGAQAYKHLVYTVTGVDPTNLLNRRLPYGVYTNLSATDVVKDLILKFSTGFTSVNVQAGLPPISVTFDRSKVFTQCLSEIGQLVGCVYKVDYNRDLHFFVQ